MNYWIVKSEPNAFSWEKFVKDQQAVWDGVRNYQARNHLKAMRREDLVLFYHSNQGQCIVGIAEVTQEFYQDPTTSDPRWVSVNLKPVQALQSVITLKQIKSDPFLAQIALVRQSRLSVMPLTSKEYHSIIKLSRS